MPVNQRVAAKRAGQDGDATAVTRSWTSPAAFPKSRTGAGTKPPVVAAAVALPTRRTGHAGGLEIVFSDSAAERLEAITSQAELHDTAGPPTAPSLLLLVVQGGP